MTRIGFILRPEKDETRQVLGELVSWTLSQGHHPVVVSQDNVQPAGARVVQEADLANNIDICVALGGDGTMLRGANAVGDKPIPLLGINLAPIV